MIKHIYKYVEEVEAFEAQSLEEVEVFRIKFLGKKGVLTGFLAGFKEVPNEEKKDYGLAINKLKDAAHQKVNSLKTALSDNANDIPLFGDLSRPGESFQIGSRHPISLVKNQIIDIFS